jgi:hypothetical protein
MQVITTIGLDIAKSVFQVHGVDASGQVVIRRQLKRRYVLAFFQRLPPCLVGIEACASSHHWSRKLKALGHTVRLTVGCGNDLAEMCNGLAQWCQLFPAGQFDRLGKPEIPRHRYASHKVS